MTLKTERYSMTRAGVLYPNPRGGITKTSAPGGDVFTQYGDPNVLCMVTAGINRNVKSGVTYTVWINAERVYYSTTTTKHINAILRAYGVYNDNVPSYLDYLHIDRINAAAADLIDGREVTTEILQYFSAEFDVINAALDRLGAQKARRAQLQRIRRGNRI